MQVADMIFFSWNISDTWRNYIQNITYPAPINTKTKIKINLKETKYQLNLPLCESFSVHNFLFSSVIKSVLKNYGTFIL